MSNLSDEQDCCGEKFLVEQVQKCQNNQNVVQLQNWNAGSLNSLQNFAIVSVRTFRVDDSFVFFQFLQLIGSKRVKTVNSETEMAGKKKPYFKLGHDLFSFGQPMYRRQHKPSNDRCKCVPVIHVLQFRGPQVSSKKDAAQTLPSKKHKLQSTCQTFSRGMSRCHMTTPAKQPNMIIFLFIWLIEIFFFLEHA